MATATVIIPARDAGRTLPRALEALARERRPGEHEVIVVDNGSTDETARVAMDSGVVDELIRRPRGDGPGAARNAGAAAATGEVLAFLDADCWPAQGWLEAGIAACATADLVQGRVLPDPAAALGPFDRTLSVGGPHGLFESANLFVRRDLFERTGGFPEGLEPRTESAGSMGAPFGEDVIFGWGARRVGARTAFSTGALAYHAVSPRGAAGFIAERRRLRLFPQLTRAVPELREAFLYRRWFLSRRSGSFDLAVIAAAAAAVSEEPLPLLAALPYLLELQRAARRWGPRRAPGVAAVELLADAYGAWALLRGSVRARSPVL
jgi:GT2 family glycosyltransferase